MADANYSKYTTSFSGTDMVISFVFPNVAPIIIGTASTVNYSIFRQMAHVRTLGRISSKGYARGGRTCAGTIVFTVINESFVQDIKSKVPYLKNISKLKPDELPPFDIVCTLGNEYGQSASLAIYGVSFVDEQMTLSIEDIITENVISFLARDVIHMSGDAFANQIGSMGLRTEDEPIGKFKLSDLDATIDEKARLARLQELAKQEAKRWEEPVMTSPGVPPKASSSGNSTGGAYTSPSAGVRKVRWITKDASTGKAMSGVKVSWSDGSKSLSPVTSKSSPLGEALFNATVGKHYTFTFSKSGYKSITKTLTIGKGDTIISATAELGKVSVSSTPGGDPGAKTIVTQTAYSLPSAYNGAQNHPVEIKKLWNKGSGPKMKLMNASGGVLSSVGVVWSYKIHNWDAASVWWRTGNAITMGWEKAGESLGVTYSNASGLAEVFSDLDFSSLFDGAIIEFIGKPYQERDTSQGITSKTLWKSFFFEKKG